MNQYQNGPRRERGKENAKNTGLLRNQCRTAEAALAETLRGVFASEKPLDRILSAYFRGNPRIGSHDRRFIGEGVYAVFRHWGVLKKLLSPDLRAAVERGEDAGPAAPAALLYAGLLLSGLDFPQMALYRENFGVSFRPAPEKGELENGRVLLAAFHVSETLDNSDLMPDGIAQALSPEVSPEEVISMASIRPPVYLRSQGIEGAELVEKLREAGVIAEVVPNLSSTLRVKKANVNLFGLELFRNGLFELQDISSQFIGLAAAPKKGERWLDLCAGAGGKSLELAELMKRKGTVIACDIRSYKLSDLRKRARRAGFPNIECREYDGGSLPRNWHGKFDGVLVDAPCSCSGVWRRNPDGRWRCKAEGIAEIADLQYAILERASRGVKICGKLIYATCSMFQAENRGVVERFLSAHEEFRLDPFPHPATGAEVSGVLQTRMSDFDGDAMFVARMVHK